MDIEGGGYEMIVLFTGLMYIIYSLTKKQTNEEGMDTQFIYITKPTDIYDVFYASIYDHIVLNEVKNEYEIKQIVNAMDSGVANEVGSAVMVELGCGTGHHINLLQTLGYDAIGYDISPAMIRKAKRLYPKWKDAYMVGDFNDPLLLQPHSTTHLLCLYFSFYYAPDKRHFFANCKQWLRLRNSHLVLHLVDKDKFDPILPAGNPLYVVSAQTYAPKRITQTKIKFEEFDYYSNLEPQPDSHIVKFNEKITYPNGKIRKHEHTLYMESIDEIISIAFNAGFKVHKVIDLVKCAYEYQYIYIFTTD